MFELWAKKRPIEGRGSPYEWITNFDREEQKFYMTDQLDREIYQECMVIRDHRLIFYREFDMPLKTRTRKK